MSLSGCAQQPNNYAIYGNQLINFWYICLTLFSKRFTSWYSNFNSLNQHINKLNQIWKAFEIKFCYQLLKSLLNTSYFCNTFEFLWAKFYSSHGPEVTINKIWNFLGLNLLNHKHHCEEIRYNFHFLINLRYFMYYKSKKLIRSISF